MFLHLSGKVSLDVPHTIQYLTSLLVVGLGIVEDQLHVLHDLHGRPVHQALEPVLDDLEVHRVLDDLVVVWNLLFIDRI